MPEDGAITLGPEPTSAAAVVIFVHGRGGLPEYMAEFAARFNTPHIHFLFPAAPGRTWYPERFLAPLEANEPHLSSSLASYLRAIAGFLDQGIPPERIILGGFSQGACLTAELLIRHPRRYGAAFILTGGFIGPPGTQWPPQPALADLPIYISGSMDDEWVPGARTQETGRILCESGAEVEQRIFDERPHMVSDEEIASVRKLLSRFDSTATIAARKMGRTT